MSVMQEVEAFKRKLLDDRLAQLTEPQRAFFFRIFPPDRFPQGVPADKLVSSIDLCDRTIAKNLKGHGAESQEAPR